MSLPIEFLETPLESLRLLKPRIFNDDRGTFVKTYHREIFGELGVDFSMAEEFFSTSHQGVIRGMHFQIPPADHVKLVYCLHGAVLDVVLDVRKNSPTFGQCHAQELTDKNRLAFLIPSGFAHGFLSLTEGSAMVYKTTTVHVPVCDAGIRWDGFGFNWPIENPLVSQRDANFPSLADFPSPF